jgi:fatty acid desaturase
LIERQAPKGDEMTNIARIGDVLTAEEKRELVTRSNFRAGWMLTVNIAMIVGAFALAIAWPNPVTILVAILILGGRQLGFGVINHECAHHSFFTNRALNDFVGHWVVGGLINSSVYAYRAYHLKHHKFAGTPDDPDLTLVKGYPASKASMRRKLTRDLTGQTGVRDTYRILKSLGLKKNAHFIVSHIVLFSTLFAVGAPWAYALWWAAFWFVYPFIVRVRLMGEHGAVANLLSSDPRENTCTTIPSLWERLVLAPNYVNFHLEHHFNAAVPCYRLSEMHRLLKERGAYEGYSCVTHGYFNVVRNCIRAEGAEPVTA